MNVENLESELYNVDVGGFSRFKSLIGRSAAKVVNFAKTHLDGIEDGLKNYLTRTIRYRVRPMERGIGGEFSPVTDEITLNPHSDEQFTSESAVHEPLHGLQKYTGSIGVYMRNLGIGGIYMIEGGATYLYELLTGLRSKSAYEFYGLKAGAEKVAKEYGVKALLFPRDVYGMFRTFLKGMIEDQRRKGLAYQAA